MKFIFLFFRNNFRKNALGNFVKSRFYGNYLIINLSGKINFFFFYLIKLFNFFKIISIEGDPLIYKNGINFWLTGTHMKIPKKYRHIKNNYVNIVNPVLNYKEKIFQIYPIINNRWKLNKTPKIIYMGKFFFYNKNNIREKSNVLQLLKKDYSQIDKKIFWKNNFSHLNQFEVFEKYKILKNFIREDIVIDIDSNFGKYFEIYADGNLSIKLNNSKMYSANYNIKRVKNIYEGNFCLDTGSIMGSSSLYPRSIQILESPGFILQNKQRDSTYIWGDFKKYITFSSSYDLNNLIEKYLSDSHFREEVYFKLRDFNKNNIKKIENSLNKVFN